MKKLRVTNLTKGPRGIYVAGRLVFVDGGKTRTFSDATEEEISAAANVRDFRVQSGVDGNWEELTKIAAPKERPHLVVATDGLGGNLRHIPLRDGEWFVGFAVASDAPDNASGFEYVKIGGTDSAPLTEGDFVPLEYLNQPAAKLEFEGRSKEVLEALLEAEKSDQGKQRKGVIATLEELLTEPTE